MTTVYYKRRRGSLECENIKLGTEGAIKLRFEDALSGAIRLGAYLKKIDGNSCIFDTGALEDGIYTPKIYLKGATVEAEGFEISNGKPCLLKKDDAYIRALSRELDALKSEIEKLKETLQIHDEKINGNPIF